MNREQSISGLIELLIDGDLHDCVQKIKRRKAVALVRVRAHEITNTM